MIYLKKWYKKSCFLIYNLYNFINNSEDSIDIFMIIHIFILSK